jgi:hypothetical protein
MPLTVCLHCSTPTDDHDGRCRNCGHYAAQPGSECECPNCVPETADVPALTLEDSSGWDWRSRGPARFTGSEKRVPPWLAQDT